MLLGTLKIDLKGSQDLPSTILKFQTPRIGLGRSVTLNGTPLVTTGSTPQWVQNFGEQIMEELHGNWCMIF